MTERESYWQQAVERQARSGDSIAAFCEAEGVSTASFYAWRRRLRDHSKQRHEGDQTPRLVPLTVSPPPLQQITPALPHVEIVLPDGVLLRVPDGMAQHTLRDVLAALEPDRC
jgi:transposase-like protein